MTEITQLEAAFQQALLATMAATPQPPPLPHTQQPKPSAVQHSSHEDREAGLTALGVTHEGAVEGIVQMGRAEVHAAEVVSIQEAFVARLAAADEEIELKSARLAELEVCLMFDSVSWCE